MQHRQLVTSDFRYKWKVTFPQVEKMGKGIYDRQSSSIVAGRQGRKTMNLRKLNIPSGRIGVTREQPGDENGKMSLGLVRNLCHIPMFECDTAGNRELKLFEQDSEVLGFVF